MRLRFLVAIAAEDWAYRPGEFAYIEGNLAKAWIAAGIALHLPITIADETAAVKEQPIGQQ